ncbi:MAG: outer membrane beta-barrel protein [Luteibaculaceae bacterium]
MKKLKGFSAPYQPLKLITTFLLSIIAITGFSQNLSIFGKIFDATSNSPLPGVNVKATSTTDSTQFFGAASNAQGEFLIRNIPKIQYKIEISYLGYENLEISVDGSTGGFKNLGTLTLQENRKLLDEVEISEIQTRATLKGDTTEFNAAAFRTNPDASAEDLVRKMPGVTLENGQIKAQGEEVKRVLVNGREFFGDDARTALQTLPAQIIQGVQVFDQQSDQTRLSGFDDGNQSKVINIITKPGMSTGTFGRVYGGYGTDNRYQAGGNINFFKDKRKITLLGLSNNINQQNFSGEDLAGIAAGGGGGRAARWRRSGNEYNFVTGNQSGINEANSIGINYSDEFGKRGSTVTLSYFFNRVDNVTENAVQREFFIQNNPNNFYNESRLFTGLTNTHRINGRLEYKIDSVQTLIVSPRINFGNRRDFNGFSGSTLEGLTNELLNSTQSDNRTFAENYNINNTLTYKYDFKKKGRNITVNADTEFSRQEGNGFLLAENFFAPDENQFLDQFNENESESRNLGARFNFTEPLSEKAQLQLNFSFYERVSKRDQKTNNFDASDQLYSILDTLLSNEFINNLQTTTGGLSYQRNIGKHIITFGSDFENVYLLGEQSFPFFASETRNFNNILPNARWFYNISRNKSIRLFYRSRTRTPGISELQNVVDNSNPLFLSSGNPNLGQSITHSLFTRYFSNNTETGRNFFMFVSANHQLDFIGNSLTIAQADTEINGVLLRRGGQFSQPVNLDGFWNFRTYMSIGSPLKAIKSNISFNAGINYTQTPSLINENVNLARNTNLNTGITLSSNISEELDFTLTFNPNYNFVVNSVQPQLNNNFYSQLTGFKVNYIFLKRFVASSDINHTLFTGLGEEFNQNFFLWNAGLGFKFLKNNLGDLRLVAFDLLNQNNSIVRNVTETFVEDNETRVLNQFFMVQFTYTIRSFKNMKDPTKEAPEIRQWNR